MDAKKKIACDIVVVGGGNAGLVAAIEAKNAGADVLILEKAPKKSRGGNSRFSGGLFRIAYPGGTKDFEPLLKGVNLPKGELDIEPYSKDDFYNKVMKLSDGWSGKRFTEILVYLRKFCDFESMGQVDHFLSFVYSYHVKPASKP